MRRLSKKSTRRRIHFAPPGAHTGSHGAHIGCAAVGDHILLNWTGYQKQLVGRIGEFAVTSPDTVRGYQTLSKAGAKTGHLDAKTRELIALAVSVTTRCDGCITVHTAEALKLGASREEIADALGVAVALNAGATMVYSARTMDAVAALQAPGAA